MSFSETSEWTWIRIKSSKLCYTFCLSSQVLIFQSPVLSVLRLQQDLFYAVLRLQQNLSYCIDVTTQAILGFHNLSSLPNIASSKKPDSKSEEPAEPKTISSSSPSSRPETVVCTTPWRRETITINVRSWCCNGPCKFCVSPSHFLGMSCW